MQSDIEEIECDVLVVGGGVAGLQSAVEALHLDAHVVIASKGNIARSGSSIYSDILCEFTAYSAAINKNDSIANHIKDLLQAGRGMNNKELVEIFVRESIEWLYKLEEKGVRFDKKDNGDYVTFQTSGHSVARGCTSKYGLAREILNILSREAKELGAVFYEKVMVTDVHVISNKIAGAIAIDLKKEKLLYFRCPTIILATGGAGQLFELSTNPIDVTADGIALAYKAGAKLTNLEFIQPLPLVVKPIKGYFIISSVLLRGELYDKKYNKINIKKSSNAPIGYAAMDFIEKICLTCEFLKKEGRVTDAGGLYWRCNDSYGLHDIVPKTLERFSKHGVKLEDDFIEIAPGEHEFIGGAVIDRNAHTTIHGLYYPGEGGAGIQGAVRITGSTFPQSIVFGARAGRHAAKLAKLSKRNIRNNKDNNVPVSLINKTYSFVLEFLNRPQQYDTRYLRKNIQRVMSSILVLKDESSLKHALYRIQKLKQEVVKIGGDEDSIENRVRELITMIENKNILLVSMLIIKAMLNRKETRGHHKRLDYPLESSKYSKPQIITK